MEMTVLEKQIERAISKATEPLYKAISELSDKIKEIEEHPLFSVHTGEQVDIPFEDDPLDEGIKKPKHVKAIDDPVWQTKIADIMPDVKCYRRKLLREIAVHEIHTVRQMYDILIGTTRRKSQDKKRRLKITDIRTIGSGTENLKILIYEMVKMP